MDAALCIPQVDGDRWSVSARWMEEREEDDGYFDVQWKA